MADEHSSRETVSASDAGPSPGDVVELLASYWLSWLVALGLAIVAGVLYEIGGFTIDTWAFVIATLIVLAYRVVTFRQDIRDL